MALVTVQRSPSPSIDPNLEPVDSSEDFHDGKSQMRKSLSQSYFTVKGAALILPHTEFTRKSARKSHGGEIQNHLQAMLHLVRPEDTITIAVRLEDINHYQRYLALVSTRGRQDTEEAVVLGIDCSTSEASIGLVLPMWMGLKIKLGGDGGFSLCTDEQCYLFKPVSVQAMWSAIQSLVKVQHIADDMKYIPDGLTHTWIGYYKSRIDRQDSARVSQWNVEGVEVFAPSSLSIKSNDGDERIKLTISQTLKEVMMTVDLDEATSRMLRKAVEEKMNMSLAEFKSYFDEEVMRILGQMDEPSEILEFLYLGSEWNACNLDELLEKGVGYILNITKEIDNFFEGRFHYYNVRVHDEDASDLLKHWDKTYKFISKARSQKSKVLVHCKMGVSRSASTVMAFIMKDRRWSVEEAFKFVKERRSCVHPNAGFMEQLHMYEGILTASNKRDIFRSKSDQNLLDEGMKEEAEPSVGSFLGDSLFRMMSHSDWPSACGGVALEEEWFGSLQTDQAHDSDLLQMDADLETESRSADSMEEVLPDLPSPAPETIGGASYTVQGLLAPLTTASQAITRPCVESSSLDIEIAQEPGVSLEIQPDTALCPSEDTGCLLLQTSIGVLSSRVKPDSSWIRLDSVGTEPEKNDSYVNNLLFTETVPSDDSSGNTQPSIFGLETNRVLISQGEMLQSTVSVSDVPKVAPAATSMPESLPYFSTPVLDTNSQSSDNSLFDKMEPHAQFYIGNAQNSLNLTPTVPSIVVSSPGAVLGQPGSNFTSRSPTEKTSSNLTTFQHEQTVPPPYLQSISLKQEQTELIPQQTLLSQPHREVVEIVEGSGGVREDSQEATKIKDVDSNGSDDSINSPQGRSQDGVHHCFVRENIPWKPGKVKKMQEVINKTGQVSQDEDVENDGSVQTDRGNVTIIQVESLDVSDESSLLDQVSEHQPATTLSHSHSCMELCTQGEGDPSMISLYEREKIPLTPGTVLRTRLEIEERQRLFSGEGDQEISGSNRPVLRTSSLKQQRDTPRSRYTQNRRLSGPIMSVSIGMSLDNLHSVGVSEEKQIDFGSSKHASPDQMENTVIELENDSTDKKDVEMGGSILHQAELGEPPVEARFVHKQKLERESKSETDKMLPWSPNTTLSGNGTPFSRPLSSFPQNSRISFHTTDANSAGDDESTQSDHNSGGTYRQHRTKGNFDSETLALIRQIGSALLMSPTPPKPEVADEDGPCSNMVKYLVRKIEQQTKISIPNRDAVLIDTDSRNSTSHEKDESTKLSSENVNPGSMSSAVQSISSPAKSRKPSDFPPISTAGISEAVIDLYTQSQLHQDFSDTSGFQDSPNLSSSKSSQVSSNLNTNSHKLPQASASVTESKHNITLQVLQVSKAESTAVAKTSESESASSPCSPSHSFGYDPSKPSVVRHLVGRFEIKSPESEKGSSEFGYDRFKESHDGSPATLPVGQESLQEGNNVPMWSLENSSNQTSSSASQLVFKPVDSHLSSQTFSSSHDQVTLSLISSPLPSSALSSHTAQNLTSSGKKSPGTLYMDVDPCEISGEMGSSSSTDMPSAASSAFLPRHFSSSKLEGSHKSRIPKSADQVQRSASYSERESSLSEILHRRNDRDSHSDFTELDDVSMRQVSSEGRKIRRLHGKSHPLTKLSEQRLGRGPFYSSI